MKSLRPAFLIGLKYWAVQKSVEFFFFHRIIFQEYTRTAGDVFRTLLAALYMFLLISFLHAVIFFPVYLIFAKSKLMAGTRGKLKFGILHLFVNVAAWAVLGIGSWQQRQNALLLLWPTGISLLILGIVSMMIWGGFYSVKVPDPTISDEGFDH